MHQRLCFSPISTRIWRILGSKVINTPWFVRLDYVLSKVFSIKMVYYRTKKWHHLGAINTFWVLTK